MAACLPAALHRGALLLVVLAALFSAPVSRAAPADEANVHAAYVINFVRYSTWPPADSSTGPYVIAALGPRESVAALKQLARQAGVVGGRPIVVRPLSLATAAPSRNQAVGALRKGLDGAHVVYVASSHRAWNDAVIAAAQSRPMLTVGVGSDFVAAGGMFGLIDNRGRVNFTANEDAIRRSPIQVSARVLVLARAPRAREG